MIWKNSIETCILSYVKEIASPGSMHETGCSGLVHWDDPEGWYGEGGGVRMGNMCTPVVDACWCMAKPIQYCKVISLYLNKVNKINSFAAAAAAAAKSLQSCPTLWDPIDSSPPGSPIPGVLQARTLEWVAISFSNAWKWKLKVKLLSCVRLLATPWTAAFQAPPSMGFSRQEY